jgi:hypothetical protein
MLPKTSIAGREASTSDLGFHLAEVLAPSGRLQAKPSLALAGRTASVQRWPIALRPTIWYTVDQQARRHVFDILQPGSSMRRKEPYLLVRRGSARGHGIGSLSGMAPDQASSLPLLLNVRPGESRPVALVLEHSALVGCARVFTRTAAFALFLAEFEAQTLLYVYIGMSLVVALLSFAYLKLSECLPLPCLAWQMWDFLLVTLLRIRPGLGISVAMWLTFCIPIFYKCCFTSPI